MSRGFVKEDDQEEVPIVPPRADLPAGATNYVTPRGMEALLSEKNSMISEREAIDLDNESERRIAVNHLNAKLQLLNDRIRSAKVVEPKGQPHDEVRFGATVSLKIDGSKKTHSYQITGVDEADIAHGKIAFVSPIAKLLTNKRVGDKVVLKLIRGDRVFEILDIAYDSK
ncbi:GreA/GreB family elongation factor [Pricia sp. S334]|uniref:GreA/GreB family elongation factor n=1 Tax=Pricia mediterranea TaxID=3076079 RepID=A0ABU3L2M5_9FLAO|nr:GreA/GreB family elongation factor [Pricia sp. S334]MDT7827513.1 GreA/GreB family elongation factor [Pricia sp. S334]